jgi:phosphohistidine phosphatase
MKTLLLLRHAKSDWGDPARTDHERHLNQRGREAAPLIGAWLARQHLIPGLVLCSTATRTRETLQLVRPFIGKDVPVVHDDRLYLAEAATLLERVRATDDGVATLMLVGHNPGLEDLAGRLAGGGEHDALDALAHKMPTAGLAVLRFDVAGWKRVAARGGRLDAFVAPRSLA